MQTHGDRAEHDRQHEARGDDEEGEILGADTGLHQLDLVFLIWSSWSILKLLRIERTRSAASLRLRQLLALVGRRDDARLQLLAALVERLHAARHRVLDRGRGIDASITAKVATALRIVAIQMTSNREGWGQ
jgi:hypothetical protein